VPCHFFRIAVATLALGWASASSALAAADGDFEFFEKRVRPILAEHCLGCHGAEKQKSGLRLDGRDSMLRGGDSGPALVPGDAGASLLIQKITAADPAERMPPSGEGKALAEAEIATLKQWIASGAAAPSGEARIAGMTAEEAARWWSLQPLAKVEGAPAVSGTSTNPIDTFIAAKLAAAGLEPAPAASKRELLRRAHYDLTGLPPTMAQILEFERDESPDAFEKVVERLLGSAQYGEHWGRHWLDIARYADSNDARGFGGGGDISEAWRYRDWVVGAFNRDLPYNEFIRQQVAGDLIASEPGRDFDPGLWVATGLYAIGNWGNGDADKEKLHTDIVDDQIDVTGRAFLGMTLACARCHDHKFDPITTRDYYAMAGIFFSSRILDKFADKTAGETPMRVSLLPPEEREERKRVAARVGEIDKMLSGTLRPMGAVRPKIADMEGLVGWHVEGADNPSLAINTRTSAVSFSTIKLPARTIALHPGPVIPASVVWKAPFDGMFQAEGTLEDVDPNCGDGIAWKLSKAGEVVAKGDLANGGKTALEPKEIRLKQGEVVTLAILPKGEYTCDSTAVVFRMTAASGQRWDLTEALVNGAGQGHAGVWWVCGGEGAGLSTDVPELAGLQRERDELAAKLTPPPECHGLSEGGIAGSPYEGTHDSKIHIRGRYDRLGELVPRGVPTFLKIGQPEVKEGSGRLQLAQWLTDPGNPLVARVLVNRVWQHHFGRPLAGTPNNFGKLGEPPTHPELLDWLARQFIEQGWSVKRLHQWIMSSGAYKRSSRASGAMARTDPDNLLLARQARARLSAEELRDSILAASGGLDLEAGGRSIRDLMSRRRTLYVTTIRSERSSYQALFDGADPTGIVDRRGESTVAPQALWLLNHPLVSQEAERLAGKIAAETQDVAGGIALMYERVLQRRPEAWEVEALSSRLAGGAGPEEWRSLCQVLLCSNELMYVD